MHLAFFKQSRSRLHLPPLLLPTARQGYPVRVLGPFQSEPWRAGSPLCGWWPWRAHKGALPHHLGSSRCSIQFSAVAQSCLALCDPMDCSTPGFPVHHQLPELAQTHVHWVGDAIQSSHPLLSPSPAFSLSQNQSLFQWVHYLYQLAKVLEFQLQHQSFKSTFRTNFLWDGLVGSPCNPRDSQESSPTPQFKSINSSVLSFL